MRKLPNVLQATYDLEEVGRLVEGKAHPVAEPETLDTKHFAAPGSYSRRRIAREARGTRPDRERRGERRRVGSNARAQDKKVSCAPRP